MVEKDQEEKSSKVLINDIWEYHFFNRDVSDESGRCSHKNTQRNKAGAVVTVCGLHHAGTALAAAHPSDHSVGGQVHPRASGNRSCSSHVWRRRSVL